MTWHSLAAALDQSWMEARIERIARGAGHGPRPAAVAASYFSGDLSWVVAHPAAMALVRDGLTFDISHRNVRVHLDDDGWPDRMRLVHGACRPGTPEELAHMLVSTYRPIFAVVRAIAPYGLAGMWGTLADHLATSLWELHYDQAFSAGDIDAEWDTMSRVIAGVARLEPRLKARPRMFRFDATDPVVDLPMRGSCCLKYRTPEAAHDDEGPVCLTCPRRSDDERVQLVNQRFRAEALNGEA